MSLPSLGAHFEEVAQGRRHELSTWVKIEDPANKYRRIGRAYVRCWPKEARKAGEDDRAGLILASVNVSSRLRRRGHFKRFLRRLEREATSRGMDLYIEQVLNPDLLAFFQRHPHYVEYAPPGWDAKINFVRVRSSK